jgi:ATP-dependent DNA ligase
VRSPSAPTASTSLVSEPGSGASIGSTLGSSSWLHPKQSGSGFAGFYRGKDLIYAARVRAGLVPATRREVFERLKRLRTPKCPFVNLPEPAAGRWGQGLTAEKIKECVWVRPEVVADIQFLEWTRADHLKHTKFVRLRDDKDPSKVIKET